MSTTYPIAGRPVWRMGFGTMQLPGPGVVGPPRDRDQALAVLREAVAAGVTHLDTAQFYGPEVSNRLIREALHPYPDDLVIVSKVGATRDAKGGWIPAQRPAELRQGVEDNLRTLGVDRIAAVNIRRMSEHGVPPEQDVPVEDQVEEMVALRDEGKILGFGISTAPLEEVEKVSSEITCVQNAYSLLARDDDEVLDHCTRAGIAYVPYFPLGSAFPGMPKVPDDPRVQSVASRLGATPAQVGLAWLLARADNILLIPGTSSPAHLRENLAAADVVLSQDDLDQLAGPAA